MHASSALISCVGSAIQTNLTIVFLLVAQHNSNKFDSAFALASVDSVFAPASVDYSRLLAKFSVLYKKTLHLSVHHAGRGNPRIVKARSSLGISREHE